MTPVTTRPQPREPAPRQASPGVLYHRWHPYDDAGWESTKDTRLQFLHAVAARMDAVARSPEYAAWHGRYLESLEALGAVTAGGSGEQAPPQPWTTRWRLVVGSATNPALESGLTLHPLWGLPRIPGSSVKGLLHHFAEQRAVERAAEKAGQELAAGHHPPAEAVEELLRAGRQVRQIFGGLVVERGRWTPPTAEVEEESSPEPVGPETPRSLLEGWLEARLLPEPWSGEEGQGEIRELLGSAGTPAFTSGRLAVYDALPEPLGEGAYLVEPDLLNPHYPDYYRSQGLTPPSDDQDPVPHFFLAVCPGTAFRFPWRLCPREQGGEASLGDPQLEDEEIHQTIAAWLREALATWGVGAKTAAGYGTFETGFDLGGSLELEEAPPPPEAASAAPPPAGAPAPVVTAPPFEPREEIWKGAAVFFYAGKGQLDAVDPADGERKATSGHGLEIPETVKKKAKKDKKVTVRVRVHGPSYREILGFPELEET